MVLGEPKGQIKSAFTKLSNAYKKVPDSSFAIIVGNLFAEDDEEVADLLSGKINIPLRTYFTVGTDPLPKSVVDKLLTGEGVSSLSEKTITSSHT